MEWGLYSEGTLRATLIRRAVHKIRPTWPVRCEYASLCSEAHYRGSAGLISTAASYLAFTSFVLRIPTDGQQVKIFRF